VSAAIDVWVLSGFLGSGKTTLLREQLTGDRGTAVIVNEFGAIGIDHHLLRSCEERVELLSGGCACCGRRADLVEVLRALLDDHERGRIALRRVVLETSGLADPAPIIATLTTDAMLRHHFAPPRLTVCVDALHGLAPLREGGEAARQVAIADELVITKLDLVQERDCAELAALLAALNPHAALAGARGGHREPRAPTIFERARRAGRPAVAAAAPAPGRAHAPDLASTLLEPGPRTDWVGFAVWLSMLLAAWGERVLRVKGLVALEDGSVVSVNGVQHTLHPPEHLEAGALAGADPGLVLITRGLDPDALTRSYEAFQRLACEEAPVRA